MTKQHIPDVVSFETFNQFVTDIKDVAEYFQSMREEFTETEIGQFMAIMYCAENTGEAIKCAQEKYRTRQIPVGEEMCQSLRGSLKKVRRDRQITRSGIRFYMHDAAGFICDLVEASTPHYDQGSNCIQSSDIFDATTRHRLVSLYEMLQRTANTLTRDEQKLDVVYDVKLSGKRTSLVYFCTY
jgi:hypothetical protein